MVNLITGPKGSGKTQQIIALDNEKVKSSNGNIVLIKKSHRDTYSVDFNVRAICMDDYKDIATLEEFVGFLNNDKNILHKVIHFEGEKSNIEIDVALQYTDTYSGFWVATHKSIKNSNGVIYFDILDL